MKNISRYSTLKTGALAVKDYLKGMSDRTPQLDQEGKPLPDPEAFEAARCSAKLGDCANYLVFHDYYTEGVTRLVKAKTCKQHLLCPFCAARRASRMMSTYLDKINHVRSSNNGLKPVMVTLTVKNGSDLSERFEHLKKAFQRLVVRRREFMKRGWGSTEFRKIHGAVYSFEFSYNQDTSEWHPHIHMIALISDWIDRESLSSEWESITGDSKIVDVRLIRKSKSNNLESGLAEVLKYALKFSSLGPSRIWEAYLTLRGKRLMGSLGSLRGIKEPDSLLDDPLEGLPYLEFFYQYRSGSYRLVGTPEQGMGHGGERTAQPSCPIPCSGEPPT